MIIKKMANPRKKSNDTNRFIDLNWCAIVIKIYPSTPKINLNINQIYQHFLIDAVGFKSERTEERNPFYLSQPKLYA